MQVIDVEWPDAKDAALFSWSAKSPPLLPNDMLLAIWGNHNGYAKALQAPSVPQINVIFDRIRPRPELAPATLVRESYREGGKVRKRTLSNLRVFIPSRRTKTAQQIVQRRGLRPPRRTPFVIPHGSGQPP
jgi:hypothetical protein